MQTEGADSRQSSHRTRGARWIGSILPLGFVGVAIITWLLNQVDPKKAVNHPFIPEVPLPKIVASNAQTLEQIDGKAAPADTAASPPKKTDSVDRLDTLVGDLEKVLHRENDRWTDADSAEIRRLESQILGLGASAASPLIAQLARRRDGSPLRVFLFQILRQLPGDEAHVCILSHARDGADATLRTMAIEALGRRSDTSSLEVLSNIARFDPELPVQPLFDLARDPNVPDTELPHDTDVTPRLRALSALGAMNTPAAMSVLADLAQVGPDASIRMHAARHLQTYASLPNARDVLMTTAMSDPSPYVRLAAIGSLSGQQVPMVTSALSRIATRDSDAGVRMLAARVLGESP